MANSLSNLVDNLPEGIRKIKCKDCYCFLEYENAKDDQIKYKCLSCNKDYLNKLGEELKKKFKITFKFFHNDINKFILLLRNSVYPYEYIDDWKKFQETTLPEIQEFYSNLNMGKITDADYMHGKRVCRHFEKKLGEYHYLYDNTDMSFLAHVFENFKEMRLKIFQPNPAKYLQAPGLAWRAALKKTDVKLE